MMNQYAPGAYTIAQARANGRRPAGPVIVALNGDPGWDNAIVIAAPDESYRWDWAKGLPSIVVLIGKETRFKTIIREIEACEPGQLDVIDTDRKIGWMVLFTRPKLVTLKWPKHQVADWLGESVWHNDISKIKSGFGLGVV